MKYHRIMSAVLISTLMLSPVMATAKGGGARSVSISKSTSSASRSASSASRAAASSRSSSNNAALWASLGATNALLIMSRDGEDSKAPADEIARRINIINLAKDSNDEVVLKEANIARSELAGYQEFREEVAKDQQSFYKEQFDDKNPQDEIAKRMNIINMVGSSDDAVLTKEADIARNELLGYREYRDNLISSQTSEKKNPKDEIMKRISIIMLAKDSKDDVVQKEADVARNELSGYQEYRASNGTKSIADSRYIQDEIEWRINVIKIAEKNKDDMIQKEADIAKAELEAYRAYKDNQEKLAAEREQLGIDNRAKANKALVAGLVAIGKYGLFGLGMLALFAVLRYRKNKRDAETNKYINNHRKRS